MIVIRWSSLKDEQFGHPKVKAWLAARPRWHMHFTPTYSSWINQVERFFALITDKAIRRGSFPSVKQLVQKIDHFVDSYNDKCQPDEKLPRQNEGYGPLGGARNCTEIAPRFRG